MPTAHWKCNLCYRTYPKKSEAITCEKEHEEERKEAEKKHTVLNYQCSVTWTLECVNCKEEFDVDGEYGRGGVVPLITEDDDDDEKTWECPKCGKETSVNYSDVDYAMS